MAINRNKNKCKFLFTYRNLNVVFLKQECLVRTAVTEDIGVAIAVGLAELWDESDYNRNIHRNAGIR